MSTGKYVVIGTWIDGTMQTYGPFSDARADAAVAALEQLDGVEQARALPLISSSELARELPDWRRAA